MAVLFFLMKIILWLLLGIVLSALILLGILLFASVHYQIYFEKYEDMAYEIRWRYLGGVRGLFTLEDGKKGSEINVFWKAILAHKEKETDTKVQQTKAEQPNKEKSVTVKHETKQAPIKSTHNVDAIHSVHRTHETSRETVSKEETFDWHLLFQKLPYTFAKECLIFLKEVVKVIAPQSWDFELIIGAEDPADTGEWVAKLTMLYPLYYRHGSVIGDYKRAGVSGGFLAEGKFRLVSLVACLIRFLLKRSVRSVIGLILKDRRER